MKFKLKKISLIAAASSVILLQSNIPAYENLTYAASVTSATKQVVNLTSSSSLVLQDAHFLMQDQGRVLAYSIEITNKGKTSLQLNDYWIKLKTKTGQSYSVKLIDTDKSKSTVAPASSQTLTYYSIVDSSTKLSDFQFEVVEWDFSAIDYERKLGTIQYPAGTSDTTKLNAVDTMYLGNVKINSYVSNSTLTEDINNYYLSINYSIENKGMSTADLSSLQLFIQTADNNAYAVNSTDLKEVKLSAGEKKTVTLRTTLPKSILNKSLSLIGSVVSTDAKLNIPITTIELPTVKKAQIAQPGKTNVINMSGKTVNTFVDSAIISGISDDHEIAIQYALRNVGTEALAFPDLSFFLYTDENISYPLTYEKPSDTESLLPQIRKSLLITGEIPEEAKLNNAKLIVKLNEQNTTSGAVIAVYEINSQHQQGSVGSTYSYTGYGIRLSSLMRTSSENDDLLMAELEITNQSKDAKSIPNLSGYFIVNGVKLNNKVSKLVFDNQVTLAPNGKSNIVVYTKIPYSTQLQNISFVLTEISGTSSAPIIKSLFQYSGSTISEIVTIDKLGEYKIQNPGSATSALMRKFNLLKGDDADYFYTEFVLENEELRAAPLSSIGGYLVDTQGEIIPVTFGSYQKRVSSYGKVLISAWAKVSRTFDTSDFNFVIGRAISEKSDTSEEMNVYIVKPVKYDMNLEDETTVKQSLENISLTGYSFTMKNVNATFSVLGPYTVNGIKLVFDYDLIRDKQYDYIAKDNKIMIEFVDQGTGKTTYSKEISLVTGESGDTVLKEIENGTSTIIFEDEELQSKIQSYEKYVLNVYDVFNETKLLIASEELEWFKVK